MDIGTRFIPTAGTVGMLAQVTEFFLLMTLFAFLASTVFFVTVRTSVAPEHRLDMVLSAAICAVAGLSYFFIHDYYHEMLRVVSQQADSAARADVIHDAYLAIDSYRYIDWSITTPLLLIKTVLMLNVRPHQARWTYAALISADFWMVLTGFIGEQQLTANQDILVGPRLIWGTISTLGYLVIPLLLWYVWRRFRQQANGTEQRAYMVMALSTVTTWGVYPLGFLVPVLLPTLDFNWLHIAFSTADIVNKTGVGVIAYLAAAKMLDDRLPKEANANTRIVE